MCLFPDLLLLPRPVHTRHKQERMAHVKHGGWGACVAEQEPSADLCTRLMAPICCGLKARSAPDWFSMLGARLYGFEGEQPMLSTFVLTYLRPWVEPFLKDRSHSLAIAFSLRFQFCFGIQFLFAMLHCRLQIQTQKKTLYARSRWDGAAGTVRVVYSQLLLRTCYR